MAESAIDRELQAIKTITDALQPLDEASRDRALNYVVRHLEMSMAAAAGTGQRQSGEMQREEQPAEAAGEPAGNDDVAIVDIRSLRDAKDPKTDVEMAAVVAYYLAELAPEGMRKKEITTSDINTFFNQAGHPLPGEARCTLTNAKIAGYLASAGRGKYKLNPVGHNLVAHTLPRAADATSPGTRKKTKKGKTKKAKAKKKSSKS